MTSLADLNAEVDRLNIGPDDYLVITVNEPRLDPHQAQRLSDYVHRSFPQLANRIIIKPPTIEIESKTREEVVADANVPPWLREPPG